MTRMPLYVSMAVAGLTVCSLLVLRHAYRTAPLMPPSYDPPALPRRKPEPVDRWQESSRFDSRTDYPPGAFANRRLREKLRQEELKQRPQEGRN